MKNSKGMPRKSSANIEAVISPGPVSVRATIFTATTMKPRSVCPSPSESAAGCCIENYANAHRTEENKNGRDLYSRVAWLTKWSDIKEHDLQVGKGMAQVKNNKSPTTLLLLLRSTVLEDG